MDTQEEPNTDEYEKKITELMMKTYSFRWINDQWYKCGICRKRFSKNYIGFPMNERMEQHYYQFHSRQKAIST